MVLSALVFLLSSEAPVPVLVAVPATKVSPDDRALVVSLSQVVARQVTQSAGNGARVVSADDMASLLGAERERQLLGCDETETSACMAEISAALNAGEVVSSSATLVTSGLTGKQWLIEVKRVDGRTGLRRGGSVVRVCGGASSLLAAAERAVREAYGVAAPSVERGVCPPSMALVGLVGGGLLVAGGGISLTMSLVTKAAWDVQQVPGASLTVSRADARVAEGLFLGGAVAAVAGVGLVVLSGVAFGAPDHGPQVALVPTAGGAMVSMGGAF